MKDILTDAYAIWAREIRRYFKLKLRIVGGLSQPLIYLIIMGFGFGSFITGLSPGTNYLEWFAPGIIGLTILFTSLFAGVSVVWERQFGFLKEILVAPVKRISITLGKIGGIVSISTLLSVIILAILLVTGIIPTFNIIAVFQTLGLIILTSIIFASLGVVIAAELNNVDIFQSMANFIALPTFFLSTALFPIVDAPTWMQWLAYLNPLTYAVDGMRGLLIGTYYISLPVDILSLSIYAIILLASANMSIKSLKSR
jgi:ABC-2 type transport system permease protein